MRIFVEEVVGLRMILVAAAGAAKLKTSEVLYPLPLIEATKMQLQSQAFHRFHNMNTQIFTSS